VLSTIWNTFVSTLIIPTALHTGLIGWLIRGLFPIVYLLTLLPFDVNEESLLLYGSAPSFTEHLVKLCSIFMIFMMFVMIIYLYLQTLWFHYQCLQCNNYCFSCTGFANHSGVADIIKQLDFCVELIW